jgi:anaerobic sulfite reductase subunit C
LDQEDFPVKWSREAQHAVSRVPFFVRKRVRKRVEEEATRFGEAEVTLSHVRACQEPFLNRMEEEVKGYQVETCFGQSGCLNRAVVRDHLAAELDDRLAKRDLKDFLKQKVEGPLKMHHEFRVSVSDCPNACSRPQIVDVGLIGACVPESSEEQCTGCGACVEICKEAALSFKDGPLLIDSSRCLYCGQCVRVCPTGTLKIGKEGYRILVGGKLGRHPMLARELPGVHSLEETLSILERCIDFYQKQCRKGERFGEILERLGSDALLGFPDQNP